MRLKLEDVGYDPAFYPRVNGQPDWLTILRYTEALVADPRHDFPEVNVVRAQGFDTPYLLIDGVHRSRSYHNAKRETIPAIVEKIPQSKWFSRSVELNCRHGRSLDTGDKAYIATKLESDGWSIDEVAKLLCMKVESLEKIKASRIVKLSAKAQKIIPAGRGNRQVNGGSYGFLKAPMAGAQGMASSVVALQTQGSVASHDVLGILDSMIAVLRAGVLDMSNEEVSVRVSAVKELLDEMS